MFLRWIRKKCVIVIIKFFLSATRCGSHRVALRKTVNREEKNRGKWNGSQLEFWFMEKKGQRCAWIRLWLLFAPSVRVVCSCSRSPDRELHTDATGTPCNLGSWSFNLDISEYTLFDCSILNWKYMCVIWSRVLNLNALRFDTNGWVKAKRVCHVMNSPAKICLQSP